MKTDRLAIECLACADALRVVCAAISRLIYDNPPTLKAIFPASSRVLCDGIEVARALESIASVLGTAKGAE
jgi:hypothetical protein